MERIGRWWRIVRSMGDSACGGQGESKGCAVFEGLVGFGLEGLRW